MGNKKTLKKIAHKYGINAIFLFGSQATGHTNKNSDYDIGILNCKTINNNQENDLLFSISKAIGISADKLDISLLTNASPLLLSQIAMQGKTLFGKRNDIDNFRLYAIKKYQDNAKFNNLQQAYINKNI